jgi:hypothetical protein
MVAFKSYQNRELLAATPDRAGVELISVPNLPVDQIPRRALWKLGVVKHLLSPSQVAALCFTPFVVGAAGWTGHN